MIDSNQPIFTEPNTVRFQMYKKDSSRRGQSLALAQILQSLADNPHYHEFGDILKAFRFELLEVGRTDDAESLIVESLRSDATEIFEICEDSGLSEIVVKFYLGKLIKDGKVSSRQNYSLNVTQYFLA